MKRESSRTSIDPLSKLRSWLDEERARGVTFPNGAVLGTVGVDGSPRTRMLGAYLGKDGTPRFYTAPTSRKVLEIQKDRAASLTFGFQSGLRSVTIEGSLIELNAQELNEGWRQFDTDFRKHYLVFGSKSGASLESLDILRREREQLAPGAEETRPESFIGFRFHELHRIVFYTVVPNDFAVCEEFRSQPGGTWVRELKVP